MKRVKQFGETIEGYNIPVLNEREIRASAGILYLVMFWSEINPYQTPVRISIKTHNSFQAQPEDISNTRPASHHLQESGDHLRIKLPARLTFQIFNRLGMQPGSPIGSIRG